MEQFLKRISFFLIYLPALVYACQFAYYAGLCEPLGIKTSALGLSYPEVTLYGYLYTTLLIFENLFRLVILLTIALTILACSILAYWKNKYKDKSFKSLLNKLIDLKKYIPPMLKNITNSLNNFGWILCFYIFIIFLTFVLILYYYNAGVTEIKNKVDEIITSTNCNYKTGYIKNNSNNKIRVEHIACGHYKCYGIAIDDKEAITYLPEQYIQPIDEFKDKIKVP
ncbi:MULTISPECIES: hypothetical protein [Acinetobacter calcoaceticus/baumannii complex]|uniref:Uncharacterized protein n=1 Tax=Acinetobacter baumannii TaxID=470 RepID=A0AAP1W752_ACIBA|nr:MULTISPECIES: hypothetical protein [Acinetobacter calcoaceticus/baumannii complex]MBD2850098.1 hypothetical protein [Acinetobacter baumannii]MBD3134453.1 hypothetical protein [Acinetobacter baumannii]MBE0307363.1 hypothetical protein [Acinetobacter baumannii]MBE0313337.1 hypothetical protein [Acinetobacter baumannii]MBE0330393.1 hypothetical protein [Acinetobacter baumannii]